MIALQLYVEIVKINFDFPGGETADVHGAFSRSFLGQMFQRKHGHHSNSSDISFSPSDWILTSIVKSTIYF